MNKLLRANFRRMWKDRVFWIGLAVLFAYAMLPIVSYYHQMKKYQYEIIPDEVVFSSIMMIGIIISIFVGMFVGTEYSDGTIRNKIVVGQKREHIYLANFVLCAMGSLLMYVTVIAVTSVIGRAAFGPFEMEFSTFLLLFADGALAVISYAAVYNLISMLVSNKAYAAVACVLTAFVLLFAGVYVIQCLGQPEMTQQASMVNGEMVYEMVENPAYLTGVKRQVYQFFADMLPGAQAVQVAQGGAVHPYRILVYAGAVTVIANFAGVLGFRKKDMK